MMILSLNLRKQCENNKPYFQPNDLHVHVAAAIKVKRNQYQ